jgi:chemotaxis protein histidine kinase CheA
LEHIFEKAGALMAEGHMTVWGCNQAGGYLKDADAVNLTKSFDNALIYGALFGFRASANHVTQYGDVRDDIETSLRHYTQCGICRFMGFHVRKYGAPGAFKDGGGGISDGLTAESHAAAKAKGKLELLREFSDYILTKEGPGLDVRFIKKAKGKGKGKGNADASPGSQDASLDASQVAPDTLRAVDEEVAAAKAAKAAEVAAAEAAKAAEVAAAEAAKKDGADEPDPKRQRMKSEGSGEEGSVKDVGKDDVESFSSYSYSYSEDEADETKPKAAEDGADGQPDLKRQRTAGEESGEVERSDDAMVDPKDAEVAADAADDAKDDKDAEVASEATQYARAFQAECVYIKREELERLYERAKARVSAKLDISCMESDVKEARKELARAEAKFAAM